MGYVSKAPGKILTYDPMREKKCGSIVDEEVGL